jgi:glucans biosynthesis protein
MAFKLHWCTTPPVRPDMAQVIASRAGAPGVPGMTNGVPPRGRKFAIEFSGGVLRNFSAADRVEAVVSASAATTTPPIVEKMPYGDVWRVIFDMTPTGDQPVELRCFLRLGEAALSETWSYQWTA